ncbi:transcription antitermination factor NusB [Schaalia suimastitidis]|uniref:transcription antitermination factor NusB n=1 Tax=Schaalia suimastitidis TaxID=121163 RepID=UPI0004005AD8|nr:transcription antitermination factor NusB [Schaalia suimastitidis]
MSTKRYADGYRRRQNVDPARQLAYEVLHQVNVDGAFANIALPQALREARLDQRDAAFASELVYGTLRWSGYLDWVLGRHMARQLADVDPRVATLLRMGSYQLLFMRVPQHAAVATTVDLAREVTTDGPAKFCNAVLRSITREDPQVRDEAIAAIEVPEERLAIQYSHPQWMVAAFDQALRAHSKAGDEIEELLAADNEAPLVTLVARPGLMTPEELADEAEDYLGTRVAPGALSDYAVLIESGDPARLPSIRSGYAGAQDEGSQLAAIIAAEAPVDGKDNAWLDLCAGPGGKTALLGAIGAIRGATILANEVHPHRARLVERSCRVLDNVDVICGDGRTLGGVGTKWPLESFDRILVDAPCSGMGSMRRRPESRWRRSEADLEALLILQKELLARAVQLLRPGGCLTYVTCSPHVAETIDQVRILLDGGAVELLDTAAVACRVAPEPLEGIGESGIGIQLWQHRHGSDLMYIAAMRKR